MPQPPADTLEIDGREPAAKRAFLAAIGLMCLILPTWDLWDGIIALGWLSLFVGIIVLGAWAVGLALLAAAIAGDGLHWTFRDQVLVLERSSLLRRRTDIVRAADVAQTEVRAVDWESGPDTYRVVLSLRTGERFETPDRATHAEAVALEQDIRRRLRLAG